MSRKVTAIIAGSVILLLGLTHRAAAQVVVYPPYAYPATTYYTAPYVAPTYVAPAYVAPAYVAGAYYRPYVGVYGRAGYWDGRYYGGPYRGAYVGRYGYGVRAGYRVGAYRRW